MMNSKTVPSVPRRLAALGVWWLVPAVLGAGEGKGADDPLGPVRAAAAEARAKLRSLLVEYETFDETSQPPMNVRVVLAVQGPFRHSSTVHYTPDYPPEVDLRANDLYYDGGSGSLTQFYPNLLYCDVFRKTASQYAWKVRGDFYLECTGWWPAGDDRDADDPRLSPYLHKVLADPKARLRPRREEVDGAACHVVERPGVDVWWLDPKLGFAPRRREWNMGDGDEVLPIHYGLSDYREDAPGVWVPRRLTRTMFKRRPRAAGGAPEREKETVAAVSRAEANRVGAEQFRFEPPPGAMINDHDTGQVTRLPGGMAFLDSVAEMERTRAAIFRRLNRTTDPPEPARRSDLVLVASIALLSVTSLVLAVKVLTGRRAPGRPGLSQPSATS